MEWTKERPTESGWYWVYTPRVDGTTLVELDLGSEHGDMVRSMGMLLDRFIEHFDSYWQGPIEQPEPPKGVTNG